MNTSGAHCAAIPLRKPTLDRRLRWQGQFPPAADSASGPPAATASVAPARSALHHAPSVPASARAMTPIGAAQQRATPHHRWQRPGAFHVKDPRRFGRRCRAAPASCPIRHCVSPLGTGPTPMDQTETQALTRRTILANALDLTMDGLPSPVGWIISASV